MKRFLLLLVTLVFAVAFAACKDKTNNTTQPTPTEAPTKIVVLSPVTVKLLTH